MCYFVAKKNMKEKTMKRLMTIAAAAAVAALVGCASIPKAKDVSLGGMYANAATETVAIGKAKITTLPESIESFVAHYSEDTAWLSPATKTRFLDVYMTGTNCTAGASQVVESICKAFVGMKAGNSNHVEQVETGRDGDAAQAP